MSWYVNMSIKLIVGRAKPVLTKITMNTFAQEALNTGKLEMLGGNAAYFHFSWTDVLCYIFVEIV